MWHFDLIPEQASTVASEVDSLFFLLNALGLLFAVPVAALIVYFAIAYRRGARVERFRSVHEGRNKRAIWALELSWIFIPFLLSLGVFAWGARLYIDIFNIPDRGLDIYVVGKQWMWKFQHPTGQSEINTLHIPVGHPVRLTMISEDVIHSFYVPAFRIKQDVLPARYSTLWFEVTQPGEYRIYCAEYCGTGHAPMTGLVIALEPVQYQDWISRRGLGSVTGVIPEDVLPVGAEMAAPPTMAEAGSQLFNALGCITCHAMDGTGIGPSMVNLYGAERSLEDGTVVIADMQYIRRSILDPHSQIVEGYPPVMPTYEGQLDEEQLLMLGEYIRSLSDAAAPDEGGPADGRIGPNGIDESGSPPSADESAPFEGSETIIDGGAEDGGQPPANGQAPNGSRQQDGGQQQ